MRKIGCFSCVLHDSFSWENISDAHDLLEYNILKGHGFTNKFEVELIFPIQNFYQKNLLYNLLCDISHKQIAICLAVKANDTLFKTSIFHDCVFTSLKIVDANCTSNVDFIVVQMICCDMEHF